MNFQLKPESEFTQQGYLYLMEKSKLIAQLTKSINQSFSGVFRQRPSQQHGRNIIAHTKSKTSSSRCCSTINRYLDGL